jgi:hypothetical protein
MTDSTYRGLLIGECPSYDQAVAPETALVSGEEVDKPSSLLSQRRF